jgi:dolichyl-phosphate beta-glucosyltransferase
LSLVIPAYNEAARIRPGLETLIAWARASGINMELVVVDDGSSDGTAAAVEETVGERLPLRILRNDPNRGKGFSVRRGMLAATGEIVAFADADFSTPIEEADKLLAAIREDGYQIAIGSRAMHGASLDRRQPFYREYAGRLFSLYYRALLLPGFVDTQCGFKFFRRDVAQAIFRLQTLDGWAFDAELLYIARRLGYSVAQVTVHWRNDPGSKVKMLRDGPRMLMDVLRVLVRHHRLRHE